MSTQSSKKPFKKKWNLDLIFKSSFSVRSDRVEYLCFVWPSSIKQLLTIWPNRVKQNIYVQLDRVKQNIYVRPYSAEHMLHVWPQNAKQNSIVWHSRVERKMKWAKKKMKRGKNTNLSPRRILQNCLLLVHCWNRCWNPLVQMDLKELIVLKEVLKKPWERELEECWVRGWGWGVERNFWGHNAHYTLG